MKRIAALLALLLLLTALPCAALADAEPRFVTIREWLDAKGECGDCLLLVKIDEVVNPVLAVAIDETGSVNLYSGGESVPDEKHIRFTKAVLIRSRGGIY